MGEFVIESIQIINPLSYQNWNEIILKHRDYSFFHSKEWAMVIIDTYNYEPIYFSIFNEHQLQSILPTMLIKSVLTRKRLVSLPFSDYLEPIFNSSQQLEEIKKSIVNYSKELKLKYIEYRSLRMHFSSNLKEYRTDLRHVLPLDRSDKDMLKTFSENTKRNIKKATKENVHVFVNNSEEGLYLFYDMFCHTRQKHGLPPQPLLFFKNIFNHIVKSELGDIIIAMQKNRAIAGAIYFKFGQKVIYKFGASYINFYDLRGNHAVMWFAIQKYLSEGYKEFDFGKTELQHIGLRKFKLGWNTEESIIYNTRFDLNLNKYISIETKTSGFQNKVFNHTPIWLLKNIGDLVYKHIG